MFGFGRYLDYVICLGAYRSIDIESKYRYICTKISNHFVLLSTPGTCIDNTGYRVSKNKSDPGLHSEEFWPCKQGSHFF